MFPALHHLDDLKNAIHANELSFFYITQPNCSVCQGLLPQIASIMTTFPTIHCYTVDAAEIPEIAGAFEVFTAPTLLLFVEGKEYIREARFVQTEKFKEQVTQIHENMSNS